MKRIGIFVAAAILLAVGTIPSTKVGAASNSIGVNPRRDYTIKAGEKVSDTLYVTNQNPTETLNARITVLDFKSKDQSGTPALILNEKESTTWSLKPYLSITTTYSIAPGKSASIPFAITIPKNVGAGSFYSAIRIGSDNGDNSKNVSLSGAAVSLFFVSVPGEAREALTLEKFGAYTQGSNVSTEGLYGTFYSATAPKYLAYLLKNTGSVAEQPSGSVIISNIFGKPVKTLTNANPRSNIVLIGQTRRIDLCINESKITKKDAAGNNVDGTQCNDSGLLPGRYTANIDLLYGNKGAASSELKGSSSFWYLPVWFIIGCAIALAILGLLVYLIIRSIRGRGSNKYRGRR